MLRCSALLGFVLRCFVLPGFACFALPFSSLCPAYKCSVMHARSWSFLGLVTKLCVLIPCLRSNTKPRKTERLMTNHYRQITQARTCEQIAAYRIRIRKCDTGAPANQTIARATRASNDANCAGVVRLLWGAPKSCAVESDQIPERLQPLPLGALRS